MTSERAGQASAPLSACATPANTLRLITQQQIIMRISKEGNIQLAILDIILNQMQSKRRAAALYIVPRKIL